MIIITIIMMMIIIIIIIIIIFKRERESERGGGGGGCSCLSPCLGTHNIVLDTCMLTKNRLHLAPLCFLAINVIKGKLCG